MIFHNGIILIMSGFKKEKNNFYYNILLEKALNELPKKSFCIKYKCYIIMQLTFLKEVMFVTKEFDICHYWYFLDKRFRFQPHVCHGCHDLQ